MITHTHTHTQAHNEEQLKAWGMKDKWQIDTGNRKWINFFATTAIIWRVYKSLYSSRQEWFCKALLICALKQQNVPKISNSKNFKKEALSIFIGFLGST